MGVFLKQKGKEVKQPKEEFGIFTKRFGKEVLIAKGSNKKFLEQLGLSKVRRTLGASLILKKGEQVIPLSQQPFDFLPSKRNPLIQVQRAKRRLSSRSEVSEIMGFKRRSNKTGKKKKTKKINWFG
jgi:hypothetical protein